LSVPDFSPQLITFNYDSSKISLSHDFFSSEQMVLASSPLPEKYNRYSQLSMPCFSDKYSFWSFCFNCSSCWHIRRLGFNLCYPFATSSTRVFSTDQLRGAGMLLIFQETCEMVCSNVVLQQRANPLW